MARPVSYLELNSPDLDRSSAFFSTVFGWELRPFAAPNYLVASSDDAPGIDTGLMPSMDGAPRAVPVIRVASLDDARRRVVEHGGTLVVEPFVIQGVGRGCYFTDPAGLLVGLHEYDPEAR